MPGPTTITLGGQHFEIQPLTLGQIEALDIAITVPDSEDPQERVRRSTGRMVGALAAALSVDHPEMTAEKIKATRMTRKEVLAAYIAVLEHSGLVTAGEAQPPAAGASETGSTGSASTEG